MTNNALQSMVISGYKLKVEQTLVSVRIDNEANRNINFKAEVRNCLTLFLDNRWGSVAQPDVKRNQEAVRTGRDRILGKYGTKQGYIYIIADRERKSAKVIFAKEATTEDLM